MWMLPLYLQVNQKSDDDDDYNGKSGNCHLLLSHWRYMYFDRSFTEMSLELSSTLHTNFIQTTEFD